MKIDYLIYPLFISLGGFVGYSVLSDSGASMSFIGLGLGCIFGMALVFFALALKNKNIRRLSWGAVGFIGGLFCAALLNAIVGPLLAFSPMAAFAWKGLLFLFFSYAGTVLALRVEGDPSVLSNPVQPAAEVSGCPKILDTSVIIDGRIGDLCETGFLEGAFITPQFILQELQHIADSSDSMKRARGRRGLDVLHRLQQMPGIEVRIIETDFPKIREVDSKIVALGKLINAKVITNDLNLNKVAELQGVHVLNINELCNALKPVVLPGEIMKVFVLKEGKEMGQGIAYLDDGTMIVVDDARKSIGKTVIITVTSVLQTPAGRMIFSRYREEPAREVRKGVSPQVASSAAGH